MSRRLSTLIAAALLAALLTSFGAATSASQTAAKRSASHRARDFAPHQVVVKFKGQPSGRAVRLPRQVGVHEAVSVLNQGHGVAYASPNYIATASANASADTESAVPNDPGALLEPVGPPGDWVAKQWNFLPSTGPATPLLPTSPGGIDAIGAWRNLEDANRPGAQGVTVAVLDTGVAYRALGGRFRRSPDFAPRQFVRGYDFIEQNRLPLDRNGHGTHVAGTIGEKTNNGIALTGLAYRAKLLPVRVLNRLGEGRANVIARGIRFATAHGADVINMSFNFGCRQRVRVVNEALRRAHRAGVVTVASVGNRGSEGCVSPPATGPGVIGVGGTTQGGCLGAYSLAGRYVDLLAPGGGAPLGDCPSELVGPIFQVTFLESSNTRRFGQPADYAGTSMAAAHVSGVAAMVIASGVVGEHPSPNRVARRLRRTARSIGAKPTQQGAGLIDADRATQPPKASA